LNDYQSEQWDALTQVRKALDGLTPVALQEVRLAIEPYLAFRSRVDRFLTDHFSDQCTQSCYENRRSACCSKDGILMFWADVAVNAVCSQPVQLEDVATAIHNPHYPDKCIFLGAQGCRFQVRPLVCAMFLCEQVTAQVFSGAEESRLTQWQDFQQEAKQFRWPDRPVLFDWLETRFMALGCHSSLMHINTSPGLLRIKRRAGLDAAPPHAGTR